MADPIKVLMADDSVVVRRILADIFKKEDSVELVFQAPNGAEALAALSKYQPDVVLLDIEMPVMNGLETVAAIKAIAPDIPVIMFSSITSRGAEETLTALSRGACDYETKPSMSGHITDAQRHITEKLIPKIVNWGKRRDPQGPQPVTDATGRKRAMSFPRATGQGSSLLESSQPDKAIKIPSPPCTPEVIAVGSSTGGPNALKEFLSQFPASFNIPIVIVQHMPPVFTKTMADRLNASCKLHVCEAEAGVPMDSGTALVAPGDFHMTIGKKGPRYCVELNQEAQVNFCRPAVDVLFKSVAQQFGKRALAVVLTGMGKDGLEGAREIKSKGGLIMAQDEQSSAVWGMPAAVTHANLASCVLPPKELAQSVIEIVSASKQLVKSHAGGI